MFSNLITGVVLGVAVGAWVYSKLQKYTGNNTQSSLTGAALVGFATCLVATTLMALLF